MNNNDVLKYLKGNKNILVQNNDVKNKNELSNSLKNAHSTTMNNAQVFSYLTGGKYDLKPYSKEVLNGTWGDKTKQTTEVKKTSAELFDESEQMLANHSDALRIEETLGRIEIEMAEKKKIRDDLFGRYNELMDKYNALYASGTGGFTSTIVAEIENLEQQMKTTGGDADDRYVQLYNQKRQLEEELKGKLGDYKTADELYKAYKQKVDDYKSSKRSEEWEGYVNSSDFSENSKYSSQFSDDEVYQYVNGANTKENEQFKKEGYGNLSNTEKSIYNYLYKTKSSYSAERFLESIQESIRYRSAEERFKEYEGDTIKERLFAFEAGWDQFTQNMDAFLWGDTDTSSTQYLSGMIRDDLKDNGLKYYNFNTGRWETAKIFGSSTSQMGYDLTNTVTVMAPSILTSLAVDMVAPGFGSAIGSSVMGASVYGSAYSEAINMGYDRFQANTYASLVAAAESGLNYLLGGVGALSSQASVVKQLKNLKVFDNVFARLALSGAAEGLEEGLQTALDPWFKSVAFGVDFEAADVEDVLYDSLIGFLSGVALETPGEISQSIRNDSKNNKYFNNSSAVESFIKEGLEMPEGSQVRKLSEKLSKKFDKNKTPTKSEVSDYITVLKNHIRTEYAGKTEKTAQTQLTKMGESLDAGKLSNIIKKAVAGETVTAEEANYLHESDYGEKILSAISKQVESSVSTIDSYVREKFNQKNNVDGAILDNGTENGYNDGSRGDENVYNQGGVRASVGESAQGDSRGEKADGRNWREDEETFTARNQGNTEETGRRGRVLLKFKNQSMAYTPVSSKNSFDGGKIAELLKKCGIETVYVDGDIEIHENGVTRLHSQGLTTPDGKVYISSNATASSIELAAHEAVHVNDVLQTEAYINYESVIRENIRWGSNKYCELANIINNGHYGGKYDIQDFSFSTKFVRELAAYVNQFVATDISWAEKQFSEVFEDWDAVVEASRQFNKEIEADFSESAFSMDGNADSQSGAKGITEPDISKDTRSHEQRVVEKMNGKESAREKDRREVKRLGKLIGWEVRFDDVYARDKAGNIVYITDEDGKPILDKNGNPIPKHTDAKVNKKNKIITMDYNNSKPIKTLLKHELTHFLETNAGVYRDFLNKVIESDAFKNWLQISKKMDLKAYRDSVINEYKGTNGFETAENSQISAEFEMVSEFVEENLFGDGTRMVEEIVKQMNAEQRSKFARFIDGIIEKLKNFFKGKKQLSEIELLEQEWLKAYKAAEQTWQQQKNTTENSGEQYAIGHTKDNKPVAIIDEDILAGVSKSKWVETVKRTITDKFSKGIPISGRLIRVNQKTKNEYTESKYTKFLRSNDGTIYEDKLKSANNLDEIILASTNYVNEDLNHTRKDKIKEFARGDVLIRVGGNDYSAKVIIGFTSGNNMVLYDIIEFTPTKFEIKKESAPNSLSTVRSGALSNNNIPYSNNVVNSNSMQNNEEYSLASDNDTLLSMYENGEITREEFLRGFNTKSYGLKEITDLNVEDANVLQPINKIRKESDGDSDSKFWESLQKSKWFDDGLKAEFAGDEFIEKYKSVSNKETLLEAKKELEEGGAAYVQRWHNLDAKHASLIDTAVGFILLDGYRRNGDTVSAVATAEKLRQIGTAGGQQIQIFSILGRLSPEAMLQYAQRELDKAYEIMVEKRSKKWIDKNKSKFSLTKEDQEFIERRVLQASILPEGRDKAVCLAEIAARIQDKLPPERSQGLKAWQRISMLLNPKTNVRNILGNATIAPVFIVSDFFGAGIDKLVSKATGVRTTGMFGSGGLKENAKAFKKGAWETLDDFKRHINTRNQELNRFDLNTQNMTGKSFNENHNGVLAKQLNDCAKVLNALDRMTSFCLEMGDRPFYEMWFVNSINNQMKLNNAKEPTPEMITIASAEALQRTWQDGNSYVTMVQNIKRGLNTLNIHGYGLGDVFVKFSKTPANLTKAIVDFSPVGLVKGLSVDAVNFKNALETGRADATTQKRFVDSLSKGIAGTMLYVLFAALAANGLITGAGDEDKDANAMEKYILGVPEYSIKLFGKWWSYEWMQPIGGAMAIVADYMESNKENPNNEWYENISEAIRAGGEVLYNQSFMQSLQTLFTADGIIDGVVSGILDDPSVLIPQFVSQIASATDKYRRVTYSNKNPWETAINKVKVKLPGIRQSLEIDKDILGRDVKNSQGNFIDAFLNPANTYIASRNDVTDEIYKLYKNTGDKTVIPRKAANSVTVKGQTHYFEIKEKNEYQRVMGETTNEILEDIFKSVEYQTFTDSEKVKLINEVFDYATAMAKAETVTYYDILSAIYGDALSETKYNSLSEKAKKALATEYFLSDYYYSNGKSKIDTTEAEYFLEKVIKNRSKKKSQYTTEDINKIANSK